jgi:hypothetical protein
VEGPPRAADGIPHDLRYPVGVEDEDRDGRPTSGYALVMRREIKWESMSGKASATSLSLRRKKNFLVLLDDKECK